MRLLKILSLIWRSGAEIYRDESDGRLALKDANKIPPEVLAAAEPIFNQIDDWFKSWEDAAAHDITIRKALHLFCGWQLNEKMNEWLCANEKSLFMLHDWTVELAKNGWKDIYEDYREYENNASNDLKVKFYEMAVLYINQNK